MSEETRLKASWDANAAAWTQSVRGGQIASRALGTDRAVLDAVLSLEPRTVLDVGCGEGWLVRALAAHGIDARGVDGSAALVEAARAAGGAFAHVTYDEIEQRLREADLGGPYDVLVCNFALLGEHLRSLLAALTRYVAPGGALVVQTLHPLAGGGAPYRAGWREETFDAFGGAYPAPMPWFFRPFGDWIALLHAAGWRVEAVREPLHPDTHRPLSLLVVARAGRTGRARLNGRRRA